MIAAQQPLVGRDRILARARELLDHGSGGIVLVGEAGVGKSRMADEVLRLGTERGYATASTVGTQAAAAIPLGALSNLLPDLSATGGNVLGAARTALSERAGGRPLVLSVDDAHLLDNHSAALVLQLAMAMPSFVIATIRSGEPVPDPLIALWKDGLAERIEVGRLDDGAIAEIAANTLGGPAAPDLAKTIQERARGNPLVARELCLAGRESGAIEERDGAWALVADLGVSARLRELVAARLAGLDEKERHALTVVAQAEPLSLRLGQQVAGVDALIHLEGRGLLALREDGRRRELWLSHPIYADVLRANTGALAAAAIKGTLAAAISQTGMRRRTDLIRVATWQLEAGTGDADLLLRAAHETYRAFDMAGTGRLAAGAWDLRPSSTAGQLLATALGYMGRHEEADAILTAVTPLALDDADRARIALAHSTVLTAGLRMYDAGIALLSEAETRLQGDEPRQMLRAQRAHLLAFRGDVQEALALAEPIAVDGTGIARTAAAMACLIAYGATGSYRKGIEIVDRVLPDHRRLWAAGTAALAPDLLELLGLWCRVGLGELDAIDPPDPEIAARAVTAPGGRPVVLLRSVNSAMAALLRGRPRDAEAIVRAPSPNATDRLLPSAQALLAETAALTGRAAEASSTLREAEATLLSTGAEFNRLMGEATLWTRIAEGRPEEGRRAAVEAIRRSLEAGHWAVALSLAHDLARVGGTAEALPVLEAIGERVDGRLAEARRAHMRGLGASDANVLEGASTAFEEMGADLLAAEAAADAGRAARKDGEPRRATRLFQRAASLAARCEGARTPALVMPDELTPLSAREREVAVLAATGLASDDIAERLFLSVRTVVNHLQHVYQKLGIGSRAELAVAMGQPAPN